MATTVTIGDDLCHSCPYTPIYSRSNSFFVRREKEELFADQTLKTQAQNNEIDNFKYGFEEAFIHKLIDRMDDNQKIFEKIMESSEFKNTVKDILLRKIYDRFNEIK